eukprot:EG_transcript_52013
MLTMIGGRAGARLGGLDGAQAQGDNVDMMSKFRSDKPAEAAAAGAKAAKAKGAAPAGGEQIPLDMVSRFPAEPEAEMLSMIGGRAGARLGGLDGAQAQGDNVDMMSKFRSDKPAEAAAAGAKTAK